MNQHLYSEIHALPYNLANAALRYEIAMLQHRAAPTVGAPPITAVEPEHDPQLNALSFYLLDQQRVISYAAVVYKQINHANTPYIIAGLSCVATDLEYQGRGLAARVVTAATQAIQHSTIDIGIFTCDTPVAGLYTKAGGWKVMPDIVLVGSLDPAALNSVTLQKVVLIRLFSAKAHTNEATLRHTTINLDLPIGQFW